MPTSIADRTKRITELKSSLAEAAANIEGMSNSWKDETGNGNFVLSTQESKAYQGVVNEAQAIREAIATEEKAAGIFEYLNAPAAISTGGSDAGARHQFGEAKSLSDAVLGSEQFQEMKSAGFTNLGHGIRFDQGLRSFAAAAEAKDVFTAMGGRVSIPGFGTAQNVGFTERTLRPGRVRDLFQVESTNASMLYGMRETGFLNRARVVPERTAADGGPATGLSTDVFGLKPKSELSVVPVTAPFATIAHIMYVHRRALMDEPQLRGILDRDMIDGVKMAEDEQILYGDGQGENLTGLLNTPGIQQYTGKATDRKTVQVRRALTRVALAYFQPTGVIVHPLDWEELETEETSDGNLRMAVSIAVGAEKRIWRTNIIDTPAIAEGTFVTGAYGTAARIYDREAVGVVASESNRDLFERNAVTLRAEETLGMMVLRPEAIVAGSFKDYVPAAA